MQFNFNKKFNFDRRKEFADLLKEIQSGLNFKISARGWCYIMEQKGFINKSQFDKVDNAINTCRKEGLLPVDFVAEESARAFSGVEYPSTESMQDLLQRMLRDVLNGDNYFTPDWWEGEKYYIQILVEKIDLKTIFEPICREYHIPVANAKGWSSILQRAEYARRFKEAEEMGMQPVLLYCGDHDPDGLRISDTILKNLEQIKDIFWSGGHQGYDPATLIIERFGLNYDFIIKNKYTWIDNLITGNTNKVMNLADPAHPNHNLPYVKQYLKKVGPRKCEANVIVTTPEVAQNLVRKAIEKFLGKDARQRFSDKRDAVSANYNSILEDSGIATPIKDFLENN